MLTLFQATFKNVFVPGTAHKRSFPSTPGLCIKIRCSAFDMEKILHSHENKTHYFSRLCTWPHFKSEVFFELGSGLVEWPSRVPQLWNFCVFFC